MSGCIIGAYGFQRSGKTLIAYELAERFKAKGCEIYSNMNVEGWNNITSLDDIKLDFKPKVLLLDELYLFMDSRMFANNAKSSIFFTTIGKQNILFIYTSVSPDMIEKRIRDQTNYTFLVKSDSKNIYYRAIDVQRKNSRDFILEKNEELFKSLKYDTTQIPNYVDCDLKGFVNNLKKENLGGKLI
jgi:hypothetical protein